MYSWARTPRMVHTRQDVWRWRQSLRQTAGPLPELVAHAIERAPDQPRDVHLRDPDLLGDLRLGEALLEAHAEDLSLALRQAREGGLERGAVVGAVELLVLAADRLHRVEVALVARPRRQGGRCVGGAR